MAWNQQVMFPQEYINLQRELRYHPELIEMLGEISAQDFELKLAQICAYVGIVLEGDYIEADFINIARACERKLYNRRPKEKSTGIILLQ